MGPGFRAHLKLKSFNSIYIFTALVMCHVSFVMRVDFRLRAILPGSPVRRDSWEMINLTGSVIGCPL